MKRKPSGPLAGPGARVSDSGAVGGAPCTAVDSEEAAEDDEKLLTAQGSTHGRGSTPATLGCPED